MSLKGQIALVTGASRGIGKGIALQLGQAGATVYVTGRQPAAAKAQADALSLPSLDACANEITNRGGKGIAAYCDHSKPEEVKKLFDRIEKEQNGRLDILVNNAYAASAEFLGNKGQRFYETDPESTWDNMNNVGLRNYFICTVHASRLMVPRGNGLIVTISSFCGMAYLLNVVNGIGKSACDRLAADTAIELADKGVVSVSLWPGAVKTELIMNTVLSEGGSPAMKKIFEHGETIEYSGKCVVALATDPNRKKKTGNILTTEGLGKEYHITEDDGTKPAFGGPGAENREKYLQLINNIRSPESAAKMLQSLK